MNMNGQHQAHLDRVVARTALGIEQQYRGGQAEHGGNLWEKPGMLAHAEAEARDGVVYLCTLREQLEALRVEIAQSPILAIHGYADKLARILGPAQE